MINSQSRIGRAFMHRLAAVTGIALALTTVGFAAPAFAAEGPQTIVSLTFDDGNADALAAVNILNASGLKGTFFVPSGYVGAPGYLTKAEVQGIAGQGHEIGGHTVNHADLPTLSAAEAKLQVCQDRVTLSSWGLSMRSFAYPFAAVNQTAENAVSACGYNSGRGLGDIASRFGCGNCYNAETLPPIDPFYTMALDQQDVNWTLDDLTSAVVRAEAVGGWLQFTFHHVCDGCDSLSITPALLTQFSQWLAQRATTNNTIVRTVGDAVGGGVKPLVQPQLPPAPGPGVNAVVNPSLETVAGNGVPQCWQTGGYGNNTASFSTVSPGRTGSVAEQLVVSGYADGDAKLLPTLDLGECAPTVTPGHTYSLRAWYKSTAVTQFAVYLRQTAGNWIYWTSTPWFGATADWAHAYWDTPVIPAGTTGISYGLNLFSNGTLITDDYSVYDTVGAPGPLGDLVAATPTVSGTAKVGETLTAAPGTWNHDGILYSYQWLRSGVAIDGATASTYTQVGADAGTQLSVSIYGTLEGYTPATGTSAPTATVAPGDLTPGTPTISGTAEVGKQLTADPGTWGPVAVTFGYQWWRDNTPIPSATAASYTAAPEDIGATLSVQVNGSALGYTPETRTSAASAAVTPGILTAPIPTISGNPIVGQTLTAVSGGWGPAPVDLSYQWLRDGTPITGAITSSFALTSDDFGKQIKVQVSGTKVGYAPATRMSAAVVPTDLSTATPTISGSAEVGKLLTADPGTWGPVAVTFSYQWWRGNTPIASANSATYLVTTDDLGASLSVQVTGSAPDYITATRTSLPTAAVTPGSLTSSQPTISGTPIVGQTLTAAAGSWGPAPVDLSYQWLRDGTPITGATTSSYLLTSDDFAKQITVQVTGTKVGYAPASRTSAAIVPTDLTTATPTISGTAEVGKQLTAIPGAWGPAPVTFSYQWLRGTTPITGATSTTSAVTTDDLGATLSIAVTGSASGYVTATRTSLPTAAVTPGSLTSSQPTISGTPIVGQTLTAAAGSWGPAPVDLSYQWLRDGTPITGATTSSYLLTSDDFAKQISVQVSGSKVGYAPASRTSTAVVPNAMNPTTPTISGTAQVGRQLTASAGQWGVSTMTFSYQWWSGNSPIASATSSSYVAQPADLGATLSVQVTGSAPGYVTATRTSLPTSAVIPGNLTSTQPTINGRAKVGRVLTAQAGSWGPSPVTLQYAWLRDGVAISGATASSYALVAADEGTKISVRVEGSKPGYATATLTSNETRKIRQAIGQDQLLYWFGYFIRAW